MMLKPLESLAGLAVAVVTVLLVSWSCASPRTRTTEEVSVAGSAAVIEDGAPLTVLEISIAEIDLTNRGGYPGATHNAFNFQIKHPAENAESLETIKVFPMAKPLPAASVDYDPDSTVFKVSLRGRSRLKVTALTGKLPKPRRPFLSDLGADLATQWAGTAGWVEGSVIGALIALVKGSRGELHAIGEGSVILDSGAIDRYVELDLNAKEGFSSYTLEGDRTILVPDGNNGRIGLNLRVLAVYA